MAAIPSIKGSVLLGVVEDVAKVLRDGALTQAELSRWLQPADQKLIGSGVSISSWYDIRIYTRMCELLRDVEGGGSNEYLRERGRETARRLLDAGLYPQLEFLRRLETAAATTGSSARFEAFSRDLHKLATLSSSILNFSRWTGEPDPDHGTRYRLVVTEAAHVPEVLCWRADGFVNGMTDAAKTYPSDLWGWERETPDRIVFRMQHDF